MSIFDLDIYKWRSLMETLDSNINLAEISIPYGNQIVFEFINTYNGEFLRKVVCNNIIKLCYENVFQLNDGLPCFICEIKYKKLSVIELEDALRFFSYSFSKKLDKDSYYLFSLESGEVNIDVLCESVVS